MYLITAKQKRPRARDAVCPRSAARRRHHPFSDSVHSERKTTERSCNEAVDQLR